VDLRRVEAVIGRPSASWLAGDVARIIAMGKAVEDGMSTWDETFPRPAAANDNTPHDPATGEVLDEFAAAGPPPGGEKATADEADERAMFEGEAVAADDRPEMVAKLLKLANSPQPVDERLEILDVTRSMLLDLSPKHAAFIKAAVDTAAKVVRSEIAGSDAKKYLEGRLKKTEPSSHEKRAKFEELAIARTKRVIKGIRILANMGGKNRYSYEFTAADVERIADAIAVELQRLQEKMIAPGRQMDIEFDFVERAG
jgi:hypothetical protein